FLLFPAFFVLLQREKWFPAVFHLKRFWARLILWPLGIFYTIDRTAKLDTSRTYVICPNHTSYLDIMLIYLSIPIYFHTMGKAELLKVPLFRKFFERMNIPVNRKSKVDAHRAMLRAGSDIEKGISVTLFPEGTIHHNGPVMGRFKNGPFHLAIEKQVPILPVTFINNWLLLPDDFQFRVGRPGLARVIIHPPIETKGMTLDDLERLKKMTYDVIDQPLREKYAPWYKSPEVVD
ncbi:MAG: lysophospholipid acyltransferase family protein, partial [Flavobacteriales bacterium]